eukprot:gene11010-18974_t
MAKGVEPDVLVFWEHVDHPIKEVFPGREVIGAGKSVGLEGEWPHGVQRMSPRSSTLECNGPPGQWCKFYQQSAKESQEAHGDEGILALTRQSQWLIRVRPLLYMLMATLLGKIRDTHIIVLITERLEMKPYFRIQDYKVMPVDAVAVELPELHIPTIRHGVHTMKMENQKKNWQNMPTALSRSPAAMTRCYQPYISP